MAINENDSNDLQQNAEQNDISIIESSETDTEKITLSSDGIVRIYSYSEVHTEEDAIKVTGMVRQITKGKKYPIMIDSTRVKEMTPESRKYYGSEAANMSAIAIAVIIGSGISRMMGNFFIDVKGLPGPPRKFFNDESKAVEWLKEISVDGNPAAEGKSFPLEILIYEPIAQMQKPIIYTFIKNGIKCLCLSAKKDIKTSLKTRKYNIFICSCTPETKDIMEIIKEIKETPELNFVKVILWAAPAQKSFFENMIKLGIKGIILKPYVQEVFESNIFKLLYRDGNIPDRRQTIRVEPDEEDRIIVAIRSSSTHKTIVGKLKSISMDGMVIELTGEFTDDDLKPNDVIANDNIKITINGDDVSVNGTVLVRKQSIVVIKFSDIQEYYKNMLSSYIYKRMNIN